MTPPAAALFSFWGTPPRKRPAPHPCPSGRTMTAPLHAGRRFPFASMPDALHPPQRRTLRARTTSPPAWITEYLRKDKRAREKSASPPYLCRRFRPPRACSRPAFRSIRALCRHGPPETPGPSGPFRARAQKDGAGKAPHLKPPDFLHLKPCSDYGKLRKTGPPDRPLFAF